MRRGGGEVERGRHGEQPLDVSAQAGRHRPGGQVEGDRDPVAGPAHGRPRPGGGRDQGAEGCGERRGGGASRARTIAAVSCSKRSRPSGSSPPGRTSPSAPQERRPGERRRSAGVPPRSERSTLTSGVAAVASRSDGSMLTTQRSRSTPRAVASWSTSSAGSLCRAVERDGDPRRHPAQVGRRPDDPGPPTSQPSTTPRWRSTIAPAGPVCRVMPSPWSGRDRVTTSSAAPAPTRRPTELEVEDREIDGGVQRRGGARVRRLQRALPGVDPVGHEAGQPERQVVGQQGAERGGDLEPVAAGLGGDARQGGGRVEVGLAARDQQPEPLQRGALLGEEGLGPAGRRCA